MAEKKFAGLYWTKEDIDSACQVYAIHIAVTNHNICTIDTDTPSAEAFVNLFTAAPELLEALEDAMGWIGKLEDWSGVGDPDIDKWRAAIAKAKGEK